MQMPLTDAVVPVSVSMSRLYPGSSAKSNKQLRSAVKIHVSILRAERRAALLQIFAERVYLRLHASCSPE